MTASLVRDNSVSGLGDWRRLKADFRAVFDLPRPDSNDYADQSVRFVAADRSRRRAGRSGRFMQRRCPEAMTMESRPDGVR